MHGRVVGVSDGDTVKLLDDGLRSHTIRLMGIDAPEKSQSYGQRARQSLAQQLDQQRVSVVWRKKDRYGRTVGKVLASDGQDVGLAQIASGMAWHYKQYANEQTEQDRQRYAEAERDAQAARMGLWQDLHPLPPWAWRHARQR